MLNLKPKIKLEKKKSLKILLLCQSDPPCQNDTPCQSDTPCRFDDRIILSLCYSDPLQKTLILISLLYALVLRLSLLEKV